MQTVIATTVLLAIVMAAMAVGVIVSGRRLRGSCGGIPGDDCSCSATDRERCESKGGPQAQVSRREADDNVHLDVIDE